MGAMTKRPEMVLGVPKGLNYKGFLDWKHAKLIMQKPSQQYSSIERGSKAESGSQRRLNPIGVVNQHMRNTSENYGQSSFIPNTHTSST